MRRRCPPARLARGDGALASLRARWPVPSRRRLDPASTIGRRVPEIFPRQTETD